MLQRLSRRALFANVGAHYNAILSTSQHVRHFNSNLSEDDKEEMVGMFTQMHSRKVDKVATRKPALPFDKLLLIETPSLLINMRQLEDNMDAMNRFIDSNDGPNTNIQRIRPNTNIHKSSEIIQLQHKTHQHRMDGIACSTVNEAELLINSSANFLAPTTVHKIRDVLLCNICIDLSKMWRFVQLYDTTVSDMRLSTFMDDAFQLHLWNYSMDEFKKTNQNILHRHTSTTVGDASVHSSNQLRLGVMLVLKSTNARIGINVNNENEIQSLVEMLNTIRNEYANNLYLRGFYMDEEDEVAKRWLLDQENQNKILNVESLNDLYIANVNEIYCDEYIFDHAALTILCTITNVYYEGGKYIHLLDCGYNSFAAVPTQIIRYHAPKYVTEKEEYRLDEYEIVSDPKVNPQHNTLLVGAQEMDIGGKIELIPNRTHNGSGSGLNATINLYNYFISINNEKQTVDGIWQIDARGPGN